MTRVISVIQLGMGGVGRALAEQVLSTRAAQARYGIELRYVALADSRGGLLDAGGLGDDRVRQAALHKQQGGTLGEMAGGAPPALPAWVEALAGPNALLVDTTAESAEAMLPAFEAALARGAALVLANKKPLTAPWAAWQRLMLTGRVGYEATVGAGLPVISTLRHLLDTGDEVQRIEGAFSGTLGFLMSELQDGRAFGQIVRDAKARGWTEPDPRDDLSGTDVARKALILARTLALPLELSDIDVTPLYPAAYGALSLQAFLARLDELDEVMAGQRDAAHRAGQRLRYAATLSATGATVGPTQVPPESALGALRGPDNLIAFHTSRYAGRPLVVQGAGAGTDVTASALLGDMLALAARAGGSA